MKKKSTCITIIMDIMRQRCLLLGIIVILSVLTVGLNSFSPIVYKILIDDFIPGKATGQVLTYIVLLILIPIAVMAVSFLKDRVVYFFSNLISEELRRKAYISCLNMEYSLFEKTGYQKAMKIITREIGRICDVFLFGEVLTVINSVLQLVVVFVLLATFNWILAIVCLVIFPILFLLINKSKNSISGLDAKLLALLNRCDNYLNHVFIGIKDVKASNAQLYEMEEFNDWLKDNKVLNWKIKSSHTFVRTILPNIVQQIAFGVILILCAYFVMKEKMTMGTLMACVSYVPVLFSAISSLMGTRIGYEEVKNSVRAFDEIVDSAQEYGSIKKIEKVPLAIEINNLKFSYGRGDFCIHIEQLSLKEGEVLAVVGESGSGKSALFDVLCRFYKINNGSVRVFGKEINDIDPEVLRSTIRLVSQNVILWNKTIEENIIYPTRKKDIDEKRYRECIQKAGLYSFIESLEQRDQTILGDFGSKISGGEKQRIALARALYSDYEILLLDEPTAALDGIRAKLIFDTINNEKKRGKSVIVVTHDILRAMGADRIAVMKDGQIVEWGLPDELLARGEYFRKLYHSYQVDEHCG